MERELLLTGIGGQGIQLATQVLARALTLEGRHVMSLGTYGGTMRGGNTESSLVYGNAPISAPPIVASAWSAIALHHRFWPSSAEKLVDQAVVVVNTPVFETKLETLAYRVFAVPAAAIATELGAPVGAAMVMVGVYAKLTGAVALEALCEAMTQSLPPYRQKHAAGNIAMLEAGYALYSGALAPAWG